jgi:RimJ/RimL family protein N-acetyltransferase
MKEHFHRMNSITIRALDPAEWATFRDFRLHALKSAPGVFTGTYEDSAARSSEQWQATVQGPGHQVFGLFDGECLIGITAAFTWREDPSGQTVMLAMSFILPEYRRRGLSRLFFDARLDWIRAQPQFKRIIVSHRASNAASRRAIERHGFVRTGRVEHVWPDGQTEDEITYELLIER